MPTRSERRWPPAVPFDGDPPPVQAGDPVEIRTAFGQWLPATAASEPRYDFEQGLGRHTFLTVAVTNHDIARVFGYPVNWPAEDVRPAGSQEPATARTDTTEEP